MLNFRKISLVFLGAITCLLLPLGTLATDELTVDRDQIKNHLVFPDKDVQQIIHSFIQIFSNQWADEQSSSDNDPQKKAALLLARKVFRSNALRYLLLDAPVETMEMVVKKSIQIASLIHGVANISNLGDVVSMIEKQSAQMAIKYGLNALMQNEIMVAPGAFAADYTVVDYSNAKFTLQYIFVFKRTSKDAGQVAIEFYSPTSLPIPVSRGSVSGSWGTPNDLTSDLPPFIISVNGTVQKGEFNNYYWVNAPDIEITFPDSVPDLGFRPSSFWQRHLWQPLENQVQDALVLLRKFIPSASGIVNGLNNIWQNISQAGASVGNSLMEFFSNAGASIVGFVSSSPSQPIDLTSQIDLSSIGSQGPTLTQPTPPQPAPQPATPDIDGLARQLAALLEQIDNVSEEIDVLTGQQAPIITAFLPKQGQNNDLTANSNPTSSPISSSTPNTNQVQNNTLANYQQPSRRAVVIPPPPPVQIIISEVKTESQNSLKEEYIELYNPNNFTVNLGGFILRKKTASGASEPTVLVSSNKFQGNIAAFGYFLITPQTITGNLQYSSADYYISQTNGIFLYDKYDRLLDKAETVIHPPTHSFGRESSNAASNFEIQLPTPGYNNQKDTFAPRITILTKPNATTSATTAEFSFFASKPDCVFDYQLDNNLFQKASGGQTPTLVKLKDLALGQHSFQVRATDPVGNVSSILEYNWTIIAITTSSPSTTTPATSTPPVLLISEVQICGAPICSSSTRDNDFIEIFNPNNQAINIADFQLKKRAKTGSEDSVRVFPTNSIIPANGYFLWANSNYLIPGLAPNATSTKTLASDNSIALFYADHTFIIDQVAWGDSTNPFVETASALNPLKGYTLGRKWTTDNQAYQDTDNNQNDFEIQMPTPGAKNEKDLTPPETAIIAQPPALTNQSQAIFSFSANEQGSTFQCRLNSQELNNQDWQNCASPITYTNLPDGPISFQVKAFDLANNEDQSPAQYGWTVDTRIASPLLSLTDPNSHSIFYTNNRTVKAEITQDQDTTDQDTAFWFLSENPEKPATNTPNWLATKPLDFNLSNNDGIKTVFIWTKDTANNISQLGNSASIVLDTTPPETVIDQSPATSTNQTQAAFAFSSNEAGANFLCKLDATNWLACASSTVFNNLNEGVRSLEVKALDLALNIDESPAQYNWLIEPPTPEPPELSAAILEISTTSLFFTALQGAGNPASQNLIIKNNGQAEMPWSMATVANWDWVLLATTSGTLPGNTSTSVEISVDLTNLEPGNYQATTTITADETENSPQIVQINLVFEELPNQLPIADFSYSPNENLLVGDEITFDASSSTDDVEITAFIWDFGDGSTTTVQTAFTSHIFNTAGQFQVLLTVQDDRGATSSPISTILTIAVRPESRLLITEIQICGAPICSSSTRDHDFVEIFNPNNQAIDITDFQLKKQTSTGTSTGYSLRVFPASSTIPANGYFLWANSNYVMPGLTPDATSTQTLASNNSVALFYTDHATVIDQVAWGDSVNPFMETAPWTPNPADNQTLTRRQDGSGNYLDTNNNSADFVLASSTPTNSLGQTIQPATSSPATTSPAYDPTVPVITDLQANSAADRQAIDLWWSNERNNNVNYYLINYNNQTLIFNTTSTNPTIFATTIAGLIGGQSYQFTVQAITSSGATSGPSNIATATPLLAFQNNVNGEGASDGTVNDLYSGLMWIKNGTSSAANNGQPLTWFAAKDFCDQLVMCGNNDFATTTDPVVACTDKGGVKYDDWRLPNFKELALLIKYQKTPSDGVMIDSRYFQNIASDKYWSASFQHYSGSDFEKWNARYINFADGYIYYDDVRLDGSIRNYVLPVRGNSAIISPTGFEEPQTGCSKGYLYDDTYGLTTDLCTGLIESQRIYFPGLTGSNIEWWAAIREAVSSTLAGYTDWRLPNIRELLMSVNVGPPPGASYHWAITPDYQTAGQHWWVDLSVSHSTGQSQTVLDWTLYFIKLFRGQ